MSQYDIIVCGAGIAGIAAAHYLAQGNAGRILLLDRDQPMNYTTSKSGENYRDYWPQPCMAEFSRHSIDLVESIAATPGSGVEMNPFGYDFISVDSKRHIFSSKESGDGQQAGISRTTGRAAIADRFGYLSGEIQQVVHIHRAGAFDVHALGMFMLSAARSAGVVFERALVQRVERTGSGFRLDTGPDGEFHCERLVLAAGPMNPGLARSLGIRMALQSYLQRKFIIPDPLQVIPRAMPFTIIADPQHLQWSNEERELIGDDPEYAWLLNEFPPGLHIKPEAGGHIKLGWAYNREPSEPVWQPADDFDFPNIVLRGASRYIPGLGAYVAEPPTPVIQFCGYYTRTAENWPLIGPLGGLPGLYTVAGLSGYGTMTACAAGDLLARWMLERPLPAYAEHFHPDRYMDPDIIREIRVLDSDGQL